LDQPVVWNDVPAVPAGTNQAIAQTYADAAAAVPSEANFNIGD